MVARGGPARIGLAACTLVRRNGYPLPPSPHTPAAAEPQAGTTCLPCPTYKERSASGAAGPDRAGLSGSPARTLQ